VFAVGWEFRAWNGQVYGYRRAVEGSKTQRLENPETRRLVYPTVVKIKYATQTLTQMIPINHNDVEPRNGSCIRPIEGLARAMVSRYVFCILYLAREWLWFDAHSGSVRVASIRPHLNKILIRDLRNSKRFIK